MKRFLPFIALLLFGCVNPVMPRFTAPSAVPTKKAIERTTFHIDAASLKAKSIKELIAQAVSLAGENKPLRLTLAMADKQVDSLTAELLSAKAEAGSAQGSLKDLDEANQKLVTDVNAYVAKAQATIEKLTVRRDRWRKAAVWEGLALLGLALWTFRKPLFRLARGAMGIPV